MEFEKEILEYENFMTNQDYFYKTGTKKVIFTSVHSMNQTKISKKREPFTKGIVNYVSSKTDCFNYIKLRETDIDSNSLEIDEFKINLLKCIEKNNIKLLVDIHGASEERDFDIEFGTMNNLSIDYSTLKELQKSFNLNGINNIKINEPFVGGGITKYIYFNTNIDVVQIEINRKFRDYNNLENVKIICKSLIDFVNKYHEIVS